MQVASQRCRFVNDVLHIWERKKNVIGRLPVEWSHRKLIVVSLSDGKLLFKVCKTVELMASVEFLVVFSVAALNFSVMPWRIRFNQFVTNTELHQSVLKERWLRIFCIGKTICKFTTIVCLDTLNGIGEPLHAVPDEQR